MLSISPPLQPKINRALGTLLLILYVFGTADVQLFHSLVHDHHIVVHTEETESDPCHRAVYHFEEDAGCQHESHLLLTDSCDLCDVIIQNDHAPAILFSENEFSSELEKISFFLAVQCNNHPLLNSSRGPPEVV